MGQCMNALSAIVCAFASRQGACRPRTAIRCNHHGNSGRSGAWDFWAGTAMQTRDQSTRPCVPLDGPRAPCARFCALVIRRRRMSRTVRAGRLMGRSFASTEVRAAL